MLSPLIQSALINWFIQITLAPSMVKSRRLTREQKDALIEVYQSNPYPELLQKKLLSQSLKLSKTRIEVSRTTISFKWLMNSVVSGLVYRPSPQRSTRWQRIAATIAILEDSLRQQSLYQTTAASVKSRICSQSLSFTKWTYSTEPNIECFYSSRQCKCLKVFPWSCYWIKW